MGSFCVSASIALQEQDVPILLICVCDTVIDSRDYVCVCVCVC